MQQFSQPQTQVKKPVLIFLKVVGPPLVLYVDNPEEFYREMMDIIKAANEKSPRLIEKKANGPLLNIAVLDTQIAGVAIQEEKYVSM
jgi:hypothetical protein